MLNMQFAALSYMLCFPNPVESLTENTQNFYPSINGQKAEK